MCMYMFVYVGASVCPDMHVFMYCLLVHLEGNDYSRVPFFWYHPSLGFEAKSHVAWDLTIGWGAELQGYICLSSSIEFSSACQETAYPLFPNMCSGAGSQILVFSKQTLHWLYYNFSLIKLIYLMFWIWRKVHRYWLVYDNKCIILSQINIRSSRNSHNTSLPSTLLRKHYTSKTG